MKGLTTLGGLAWPAPMRNPIRDYAWGSATALAELQNRVPSGGPEAELWMGAHPSAPSALLGRDGAEISLRDLRFSEILRFYEHGQRTLEVFQRLFTDPAFWRAARRSRQAARSPRRLRVSRAPHSSRREWARRCCEPG